jgi:hypothetical protein
MDATNRFRQERSTGEYEIFAITGISARSIVAGKLQSSVIQSILIISISAPFMMVCYTLRGVSAPDILLNLLFIFIFTVLLTQIGILIGSFECSKQLLVLLYIPYVIFLFSSISFAFSVLSKNIGVSIAPMISSFILLLVGILCGIIYYFIFAFICSVSLLELRSRHRTIYLRIFLLLCMVIVPGIALYYSSSTDVYKAIFYYYFAAPVIVASLLVPGTTADSSLSARKMWGKKYLAPFKLLLYQGKGSMFVWFSVVMLLVFFWENVAGNKGTTIWRGWGFLTVTCTALFVWALLGNMTRYLIPRIPPLLATMAGIALPSIVAVFIVFSKKNMEVISMLICPVTTYFGLQRLGWNDAAIFAAPVFWVAVFIHGIYSYNRQIAAERQS